MPLSSNHSSCQISTGTGGKTHKNWSLVIWAAGGGQMGLGNLRRTAALARTAASFDHCDRATLVWQAPADISQFVDLNSLQTYIVSDRESFGAASPQVRLTQKPTVLVVDLVDLTAADVRCARNLGFSLVCSINDSGGGRADCDVLVDESAFSTDLDWPVGFGGSGLAGPAYRIIDPCVCSCRLPSPWNRGYLDSLLLTFGGSDPGEITAAFLQSWLQNPIASVNLITCVMGPFFSDHLRSAIRAHAAQIEGCRIVDSPRGIGGLIRSHDLVVTMGGITAYESMCIGVPGAAVEWGSLVPYVRSLADSNLALNLGGADQAVDMLHRYVTDTALLSRMARTGWKRIDGLGAQRILNHLDIMLNETDSAPGNHQEWSTP